MSKSDNKIDEVVKNGLYRVERLEPRIMLSADPFGVADSALDLLIQQQDKSQNSVDVDLLVSSFTENTSTSADSDSLLTLFEQDASDDLLLVSDPETDLTNSGRIELIIIDAAVDDQATLLEQVIPHQSSTQYDIHYLDSSQDGLTQLTSILSNYQHADAIHLLSHGSETGLVLGNTHLTQTSLLDNAENLSQWSDFLSDDADLLLYGCELTSSVEGIMFAQTLKQLTGLDVATSDDKTGSTSLGGDWELEQHYGMIESVTLQDAANVWQGTLAAPLAGFLMGASADVSGSGVSGLDSWSSGDLLNISDPNLVLGDTSTGTVSFYAALSGLAQDGSLSIDGLHYVTSNFTLGVDGVNEDDEVTRAYDLKAGDLLYSTNDDEVIDGINVSQNDVMLFRADVPGDYTSGTTLILLEDFSDGNDVKDFALVEADIDVGGQTLTTGYLVYNDESHDTGEIRARHIDSVLSGSTISSTNIKLIDGSKINVSGAIRGIDLVQKTTTLGGELLEAGQLLVSFESYQSSVGTNAATIPNNSIARLDVTTSEDVAVSLILNGMTNLKLDSAAESFSAFTLIPENSLPVGLPELSGTAEVDQTLAADLSNLSDDDGISDEVAYQWQVSADGLTGWADIDNADTNSYTLTNNESGQYVRVAVSYLDQRGTDEGPLYSDASTAVIDINDEPDVSITTQDITFTEGDAPVYPFSNASVDLIEAGQTVSGFKLTFINVRDGADETITVDGITIPLDFEAVAGSTTNFDYEFTTVLGFDAIAFTNGSVTSDEMETIIDEIGYQHVSNAPTEGVRFVNFYSLTDSGGTSNGGDDTYATVLNVSTITVEGINNSPTTSHVTLSDLVEDTSRIITKAELLSNASDNDDAILYVSNVNASSGTIVDNGDDTWTFTPASNDDTSVSFTYTISDGENDTPGTAGLTLTPVNDSPTTSAVTIPAIDEDSGALLVTQAMLLSNANDVDGDALTATGLAISSGGGSLVDNLDGTWSYTPDTNDDSDVSFSYNIFDGTDTVAGTADLDITSINDLPVTSQVTLSAIDEDSAPIVITQAQLLSNASDDDHVSLTATNLSISSGNGSISNNGDGTWTYTADSDAYGEVSFSYLITDGVDTVNGSASLTVNSINDAPTTSEVNFVGIVEDSSPVTFSKAQLLSNANDVDDSVLSVSGVTISSGNGALVDNGNDTWTYTPLANDSTDVIFGYQISDGALSTVGSASLPIYAVNDAPVTTPVTLTSINEDGPGRVITQDQLLGNASDVDNGFLWAYNLSISSGSGSLYYNYNGSWTYHAADNDDTDVTFQYRVTDGNTYVIGVANLDIIAVNDSPITSTVTLPQINDDAVPKIITQAELLSNTYDVDSASITATNLSISSGKGTLVDNGNGTWTYTAAPNDDDGLTSFNYLISDGSLTTLGSAQITINTVNDAPTTSPVNLAAIDEDSGSRIITQDELLSAANDVDNDQLVAKDLSISSGNGTLVSNGNGTWTYTTSSNDVTSVAFNYIVSDGSASVSASASMDIMPVNDAPVGGVLIEGLQKVGDILTADIQFTDADKVGELSYQWYRNGDLVEGATNNSYELTKMDVDSAISVSVSYIDAFGTAEVVTSTKTAAIITNEVPKEEVMSEEVVTSISVVATEQEAEIENSPATTTKATAQSSSQSSEEKREEVLPSTETIADESQEKSESGEAQLLDNELLEETVTISAVSQNPELKTISLESSKLMVTTNNMLKSSWSNMSDPMVLMKSEGLIHGFDAMGNQVTEQVAMDRMVVGGGIAVSSGLSIGYVAWLLRSGVILSSVLSSLPAWRFIDPLPVLSGLSSLEDEEDDASLEDLVQEKPDSDDEEQ